MSVIVFIRHAATDMAGTFCGHSNPPVNNVGRKQIEGMTAQFHNEPWDAVYSSDLERAVTTAVALARASDREIITKTSLREIHFGEWEGLTWDEIEQRDAAYARQWIESFPALPAPGGESFYAFEERVLDAADQLMHLATAQRIAVVTHAGVMRVILRAQMGCGEQEAWELTRPYCSSFVWECNSALQDPKR